MKPMIAALLFLFPCMLAVAEDVPPAPMPAPARPVRSENDHPFFDFKNAMAIGAFSVSLAGGFLLTPKVFGFSGDPEKEPKPRRFFGHPPRMGAFFSGSLRSIGRGRFMGP